MNNTKWRKLRAAMLGLTPPSPAYRLMHVEYGDLTGWDGEWFHHFNLPSYAFIEWMDLKPKVPSSREILHEALKQLHLPGEKTDDGFRIYGYSRSARSLDYIR